MTRITDSEDCFKCRGCCKFEKDHLFFAPLVTKKERDAIEKDPKTWGVKPVFKPHKGSNKVFQIQMISSKLEKDMFVCPFLIEMNHECQIYNKRPFDCRFWPFLLMKGDSEGEIDVMLYNEDVCPSLDKKTCEVIKVHEREALETVNSPEMRAILKENPELAWPKDAEDAEDVRKVGTVRLFD
ncbi:YkgJ family cysteine cluster protein [Candidatus Woesearchaeota archaeon]|nr:YkgJ family cysteine cluster protein [Candidatus Woesearchaeota archaeon]